MEKGIQIITWWCLCIVLSLNQNSKTYLSWYCCRPKVHFCQCRSFSYVEVYCLCFTGMHAHRGKERRGLLPFLLTYHISMVVSNSYAYVSCVKRILVIFFLHFNIRIQKCVHLPVVPSQTSPLSYRVQKVKSYNRFCDSLVVDPPSLGMAGKTARFRWFLIFVWLDYIFYIMIRGIWRPTIWGKYSNLALKFWLSYDCYLTTSPFKLLMIKFNHD